MLKRIWSWIKGLFRRPRTTVVPFVGRILWGMGGAGA